MPAAKNQPQQAQAGEPAALPAVRSPVAIIMLVLITVAGLAGDLLSKHEAFADLLGDSTIPQRVQAIRAQYPSLTAPQALAYLDLRRQFAPGVELKLSTNSGVVFSLPMPRWAVVLATVAALGLVMFFFATSPAGAWSVHLALGCIMGGALGNLYDRLFSAVTLPGMEPIRGQVRDFLYLTVTAGGRTIDYPAIFNVADVLLVVGVGLLMIHWLRGARQAGKAKSADAKA